MAKRNKLRYQTQGNTFPPVILSGAIYIRYHDDLEALPLAKGDVRLYLSTEGKKYSIHEGSYAALGREGYVKAELYDGKGWKPLSLEEFFPDRDYYFSKKERPLDTCLWCQEKLRAAKGNVTVRTYREHYVKTETARPKEA